MRTYMQCNLHNLALSAPSWLQLYSSLHLLPPISVLSTALRSLSSHSHLHAYLHTLCIPWSSTFKVEIEGRQNRICHRSLSTCSQAYRCLKLSGSLPLTVPDLLPKLAQFCHICFPISASSRSTACPARAAALAQTETSKQGLLQAGT